MRVVLMSDIHANLVALLYVLGSSLLAAVDCAGG